VAAAAFGSATVFGKKLLQSLDFRLATFARFGVTTMLALVYLWVSGEGLPFEQVTPTNWLLIIFIGLTTGSGAIFPYYYGLSRVRAMVSAICELCLPLSAIVFDYLINGSVLGPWQWLGAALLVMAIFKVSIASNPPPAISQSTT
jgi:drug/metabolite transporter (DMT)-like permease